MSKLTFQPTPKRFIVWRKDYNQFAQKVLPGGKREYVYTLDELGFYYDDPDCIICQSTNLFDEDGKEIFEGTIVRVTNKRTKEYSYAVVSIGNENNSRGVELWWQGEKDNYDLWGCLDHNEEEIVAVGHILSNPELLEEV